ncbi:C6 transcription factor [Penicillium herquei]|nr:C6 transcription factor [Penicillium herquei]
MCSRHHNGRSGSAWSLNGMLIRAAQWMGLHRDGAQFDISPLTCEIRRRLWFEILAADGRAAEDHALSSSGFNGYTDTKMPLNLDDRDLTPDMKEMPVSKASWTEMTLFLVVTEMNLAMQRVARLSAALQNEHERLSNLEQFLERSKSRIQVQYMQYCDPNLPLQKATLCLCHVFLGKLEVFVRHQYHRGLSPDESAAQIKEETLVLACETIDFGNELKTAELLSNFQWLFATFRQYHLLTYTLWHLCIQPGTSYADQAWETVHYTFRLEENPNWPHPGVKWNVLCKLRDKAYNIRSAYLAARMNQPVPQPFGAQPVDVDQPSNFLDLDFDMLGDLGSICFPNWGSDDLWLTGPFE